MLATDELRRLIADKLGTHCGEMQSESLQRTSLRCRQSLESAKVGITTAIEFTQHDNNEDLIAAELRMALDELASIIGEVHSENILGELSTVLYWQVREVDFRRLDG